MDKVHIDLGANSYDVIIDRGLIGRTGKEIKDLTGAKKAVILTEAGLDRLYGQDLKAQLEAAGTDVLMMVLSPHEKNTEFIGGQKSLRKSCRFRDGKNGSPGSLGRTCRR